MFLISNGINMFIFLNYTNNITNIISTFISFNGINNKALLLKNLFKDIIGIIEILPKVYYFFIIVF